MLNDAKHTERVPMNLTEREFVDCCREAMRLNKKPAEYIRFVLRQSLYGTVGMAVTNGNETNRDE